MSSDCFLQNSFTNLQHADFHIPCGDVYPVKAFLLAV